MARHHSPVLLSFSGIDGAGKSTQISALISYLESSGIRVRLLTFWDDVVVCARYRESMSRKAFRGEAGIGSPEKPVNRRDKNVTAWPVTFLRFFMYAADAISLRVLVSRMNAHDADAVIFDRYIFDELANLPLESRLTRAFLRLLSPLIPRPAAAFLIDAEPESARARKPEYPLDFLHKNRNAFVILNRHLRCFTIIAPGSVEDAQRQIRTRVIEKLSSHDLNFRQVAAAD